MDKYCKIIQRIYLAPTIMLLLLGFAGTFANANAQENTWSFEQHPHPHSSQLSDAEAQRVKDAYNIKSFIELCENVVSVHFQIYQNHYPDFLKDDYSQEMFQRWQVHFVMPEPAGVAVCFFHNASIALVPYIEQPLDSDLFYCGTYSRQPMNQREREFVASFDAFLELVMADPFAGATQVLGQNSIASFLRLNPDVVYFFSLLLEPYMETDERIPPIIDLSPDLGAERLNFVERAAQNLDLQAVLDTTQPCVQ